MRVYREESLAWDFEFWCGAAKLAEQLNDEEFDMIEEYLIEVFPEGMTDTMVNDFFWFEQDAIAEILGYEDEDEMWHHLLTRLPF